MHSDVTCKEYDEKLKKEAKDEHQSEHWKEKHTKKCPQCGASIQKNDGCDHMTCGNCKYEFCWLCLADYKKIRRLGNLQHKSTCKYYQ